MLTWPHSIDPVAKCFVCKSCGLPLTDDDRRNGRWVTTSEGPFSGWHVSQLMCPWISATAILEAKDDPLKDEQYFYNYVLGLPYVGAGNSISADEVLANCTETVNTQSPTIIIGVDTGLPIHYVLMNREGAFFNKRCAHVSANYDPYKELENLLIRFPSSVMVADQGGDLIGIRVLQGKYPGRVFLCHYRKDRKSQQLVRWGENEEFGTVIVDRNRMMQLLVEQLRDKGRLSLNGSKDDWKEVALHFANMRRTSKDTPFGTEYSWERSGPDHLAHAMLYALVGLDRHFDEAARILGEDPFANLPTARIFNE